MITNELPAMVIKDIKDTKDIRIISVIWSGIPSASVWLNDVFGFCVSTDSIVDDVR